MEQLSEYFGIPRRPTRPHLPQLIAQRIRNKIKRVARLRIVRDIWRLGVRILLCIQFLGREQSQMLSPQIAPQRRGVVARVVFLARHGGFEDFGIGHHN